MSAQKEMRRRYFDASIGVAVVAEDAVAVGTC
jgi:hypothetical protein